MEEATRQRTKAGGPKAKKENRPVFLLCFWRARLEEIICCICGIDKAVVMSVDLQYTFGDMRWTSSSEGSRRNKRGGKVEEERGPGSSGIHQRKTTTWQLGLPASSGLRFRAPWAGTRLLFDIHDELDTLFLPHTTRSLRLEYSLL